MSRRPATDLRFTYGDYFRWTDGERWELIRGEAFHMGPAPARMHQRVLLKMVRQIDELLDGAPCEAYPAPFDVRLPEGGEPDEAVETVVQPDISVICDANKLDDRGCRGAPDWIVEIVSPSSGGMDRVRKAALYASHGVREYWVLDPAARALVLHRGARAGGYRERVERAAEGRTECAALPGMAIDWSRVFAR